MLAEIIEPEDPYYETVRACHELGIIRPVANGDFRLDQALNRYEVAHLTIETLKALGIEVPTDDKQVRYHDIPGGHWAYDDVAGCVNLGLMGGFEDLSFYGRRNMLKEHWLAMASALAVKFAPLPDPEDAQQVPAYSDLPELNWLWNPINTLASYGWLDPDTMEDDFLNRNDAVTRRLLYWYLGRLIIARMGESDLRDEGAAGESYSESDAQGEKQGESSSHPDMDLEG
ncbi:S-layer homology domain-containing protein [bacterium]|nr:S-layer homology domain-containing protein [bacterium]